MKVEKYQILEGYEETYKADGMRCSPVYVIDGKITWCNAGMGTHGHLGAKEGRPYPSESHGIYTCAVCGQEIGNEKVIE
jgi:hypothetical protein